MTRLRRMCPTGSTTATATRPRGRLLAAVVALAFVAGACSGGGGNDSAGLDQEFRPTPGERDVQFTGATKLRMGATLAVPPGARGALPAALIVPAPGPTDRDGPLVLRPPDHLYKDLSASLTAAGMVTLRYDHRGVGASQMESGQQLSWDDMVADAKEALTFLSQRQEVDPARIAIVAHDTGGAIALKLAAGDARVKSVALVSAPGRRLVDVLADGYTFTNGQESADAFRAMIDGLLTTGSLPPRDTIRPEFQSSLPVGQDAFFKTLFSVDPVTEAGGVKVPVLMALGERSITVTAADTQRLGQGLGGRSEVVVAANSSPTLQQVLAPVVRPFDPLDMDSHGLGPPVAEAPRDQPTIDRIASFVATSVGAKAG